MELAVVGSQLLQVSQVLSSRKRIFDSYGRVFWTFDGRGARGCASQLSAAHGHLSSPPCGRGGGGDAAS